MPLTRFKLTAIGDDGITSAKIADNIHLDGTEAVRVPVGTTAQRANAQVGDLRYNSDTGVLEQYGSDGWQSISSPPIVTSVSPDNIDETDDPQTIVISGSNFDAGATGVLVNTGNLNVTPTTSTRNSSSQITIVFSGSDTLSTDAGPYGVKVTNGTGLSSTLDAAVTLDNAPTWTTSAGSLGTVVEDQALASPITVAATDPEGSSLTYSITSGALPTGLSLGSANGQITGTPNVSDTYNSSGVTHNFTITADDGTGNTTPRAFSVIRKWNDGSTSALAAASATSLYNETGIQTNGTYWIDFGGSAGAQQIYCLMGSGYGSTKWMVVANHRGGVTMNNGHQPRLTAHSSQVGSSGSDSYSPGNSFSINMDGFTITGLTHFAYNSNFATPRAYYYQGFTALQLPNNATTYKFNNQSGGQTVTGFGSNRLQYTGGGTVDHSVYRAGGIFLGTSATGNSNPDNSHTYPVWHSCWVMSNESLTFSFCDASASSTGWDDFQDGSGMGDAWSVDNVGANGHRDSENAICVS